VDSFLNVYSAIPKFSVLMILFLRGGFPSPVDRDVFSLSFEGVEGV